MATISRRKTSPPKEIKKFLGINENTDGEYGLKLGEATTQSNFRTTLNGQLKEREGYKHVFTGLGGKVMGIWYGKLNNTITFLFVANGHLYKGNLTDGTKVDLGVVANVPTRFIAFGTKVYISNKSKYLSYNGITLQEVVGYIPKIAIGTPPAGGGTDFEQINLLTGKKHQTFDGDASATVFQLRETNIDSIDQVYLNGVLKTVTTHYTVNLTTGQVTFTAGNAPTNVPDNVDIYWTKGTGQRALIENCAYNMDYSGQTDSRVFLWGNDNYKNRRLWSGIANGMPNAEYFEANSFDDLGSGQYAITDIVKQYDRQKIFLEKTAMYSLWEASTTTAVTATFPAYELNEEVGNVAYGQVQIVNNSPYAISQGIRAFNASTVRDQTNQDLISQRVQDSLLEQDLSTAITYNWKKKGEYWCNIGNTVWIHNYNNNTWYKFDNITATCFIEIDGFLYFGTDGTIEKFDDSYLNDNGTAINAVWEMGFYDFDAEWLTKYLNNIWITLQPKPKNRLDVKFATNNEGTSTSQTIRFNLMTFTSMDFTDFTFNTSYNPAPFFLDIQAMGFCYFKLILKNSSTTETTTVLSINLPARYGGRVT